jgi:hypothetical protein
VGSDPFLTFRIERRRPVLKRSHGAATILVLLLVYAAIDDITTDHATSFRVEYAILIGAAAWLFFVAIRLVRQRHYVLGGLSILAIAAAAWGQRAIGPGVTASNAASAGWRRPEYLAVIAGYLWFWLLAAGRARTPLPHDRVDPPVDSLPHLSA